MNKNFNVWLILTKNSFQQNLVNKMAVVLLLTGKILRIGLFLLFISFLFSGTNGVGGYTSSQMIFFFLTFNLIDTLAQMLFREAYRFRDLVISGNLDLVLTKPFNPLIRVLLGGTDPLDFIVLFLIVSLIVFVGINSITQSSADWGLYMLMILISLTISTSFHIFVLGFGILTTAVDHMLLVYRDFTAMFRIPADLYREPIKFILTFVIPLGIMMTFPPKALMGLLSLEFIIIALFFAVVNIFLSIWFWKFTLKYYTSASS